MVEGFFDGEHKSRVLPIHMAVALRCPASIVHTLVEAYPLCIHMREEAFQRLPLHVACQTNAPIETIEALIHYYPEATRAKDSLEDYQYIMVSTSEMIIRTFIQFNTSSFLSDKFILLVYHSLFS